MRPGTSARPRMLKIRNALIANAAITIKSEEFVNEASMPKRSSVICRLISN